MLIEKKNFEQTFILAKSIKIITHSSTYFEAIYLMTNGFGAVLKYKYKMNY